MEPASSSGSLERTHSIGNQETELKDPSVRLEALLDKQLAWIKKVETHLDDLKGIGALKLVKMRTFQRRSLESQEDSLKAEGLGCKREAEQLVQALDEEAASPTQADERMSKAAKECLEHFSVNLREFQLNVWTDSCCQITADISGVWRQMNDMYGGNIPVGRSLQVEAKQRRKQLTQALSDDDMASVRSEISQLEKQLSRAMTNLEAVLEVRDSASSSETSSDQLSPELKQRLAKLSASSPKTSTGRPYGLYAILGGLTLVAIALPLVAAWVQAKSAPIATR